MIYGKDEFITIPDVSLFLSIFLNFIRLVIQSYKIFTFISDVFRTTYGRLHNNSPWYPLRRGQDN